MKIVEEPIFSRFWALFGHFLTIFDDFWHLAGTASPSIALKEPKERFPPAMM
ncbi:MAG: hypothetical protein PHD86_08900 [Kiritimatiellae bacterium]|jgi:hypothetical protein|nr:hypothetical protein [Kiritimatiellia bacterium]